MNDNEKSLGAYRQVNYRWMGGDGVDEAKGRAGMRELKERVSALLEPKPVRWIDGAVTCPCVDFDEEKLIGLCKETNQLCEWTMGEVAAMGEEWNDYWPRYFWLPASDFPMPLPPEVIIEKCPVCDSECFVSNGVVLCKDANCAYRVGTLEAHNELCRRLK